MVLLEAMKKSNILVKPEATNRWELIEEMVDVAVKGKDLKKADRDMVVKLLTEREKSMSTGIGNGVAIPHCSTDKIDSLVAVMAIHHDGINFDSIDNQMVRIVIMLIVPKNQLSKHIKTLAEIARVMNDEGLRNKLIDTKTQDTALKALKTYSHAG